MAWDASFKLLPFSWPDDLDPFLDLHARVFASSPLEAHLEQRDDSAAAFQALQDYRRMRLLQRLRGADGTTARYFKIVLDEPGTAGAAKPMVACAGWYVPGPAAPASVLAAPSPHDLRGPVEVLELLHGVDAWLAQLTRRARTRWNADGSLPYWSLKMLCTRPGFQGRGLGSRLLRHGLALARDGLALARDDARRRPGRVRGACCLARAPGLRTYRGAGMVERASGWCEYGMGWGERYTWMSVEFREDGEGRADAGAGGG